MPTIRASNAWLCPPPASTRFFTAGRTDRFMGADPGRSATTSVLVAFAVDRQFDRRLRAARVLAGQVEQLRGDGADAVAVEVQVLQIGGARQRRQLADP